MTPEATTDWIRPLHPNLVVQTSSALEDGELEGSEIADLLLRDAIRERATDIHLDPQGRAGTEAERDQSVLVRFRIDGALLDVMLLSRELGEHLIRHFRVAGGLDIGTRFRPDDARTSHRINDRPLDMRLAFSPSVRGEKLSIRLLDSSRLDRRINTLGLTEENNRRIQEWLVNGTGAFLVTGPTGSGKTTTLYAVLHELQKRPCSVVTIEDPVEYQISGITQIQVDPEHGLTLAKGLKAMLRMDPDYLLLGEIRDAESARTALEAASSGRALLSTMHTRDAVATITALRNYGLTDYEISSTLEVVIAQRLVRRLCPDCRRAEPASDAVKEWVAAMGLPPVERLHVAVGCPQCSGLGYHGRIGLFEIWRLEEEDYRAILTHTDEHTLRAALHARDFKSIVADGFNKVRVGITSVDELSRIGTPSRHYAAFAALQKK